MLFVESEEPMRFWYDDEDGLAAVAAHLGALTAVLRQGEDAAAQAEPLAPSGVLPEGPPLAVLEAGFAPQVEQIVTAAAKLARGTWRSARTALVA